MSSNLGQVYAVKTLAKDVSLWEGGGHDIDRCVNTVK